MGLLELFGFGPKRRVCAGCGDVAVLRERRQPNPMMRESKQYWGCPHGPGRFCCKAENLGKRKEIDVFWPGKKRFK